MDNAKVKKIQKKLLNEINRLAIKEPLEKSKDEQKIKNQMENNTRR